MKKSIITILIIVSLLFLPNRASALPDLPDCADFDGYIVAFETGDTAVLFSDDTEAEPIGGGLYRVETAEEARRLESLPGVRYVEPNYRAVLFGDSDGWSYDAVRGDYVAGYGIDGTGVRVAVIDSGVDRSNPALAGANIAPGRDYVDGGTADGDGVYHGTKVTQVIVGGADTAGVTGIAAGVEIVPLLCFTATDGGTVDMLSRAIRDAVDVYGCDVINMSWGLTEDSQTLYEALEYAWESGAVLVASAGNVNAMFPQGTVIYPAAYGEVIGVGSLNRWLTVSEGSQQGEGVFVCAPGEKVPFINGLGKAVTSSGTSYAAPCVSAEAALIKQLMPTATCGQVQEILRTRAVDLGDPGYDTSYGWGLTSEDALISDRWSTAIKEPDRVMLTGWLLMPGKIAAARYDGDGRMTELQIAEPDKGWQIETAPTAEVKLFWVSEGFSPTGGCEIWNYSNEGFGTAGNL